MWFCCVVVSCSCIRVRVCDVRVCCDVGVSGSVVVVVCGVCVLLYCLSVCIIGCIIVCAVVLSCCCWFVVVVFVCWSSCCCCGLLC